MASQMGSSRLASISRDIRYGFTNRMAPRTVAPKPGSNLSTQWTCEICFAYPIVVAFVIQHPLAASRPTQLYGGSIPSKWLSFGALRVDSHTVSISEESQGLAG